MKVKSCFIIIGLLLCFTELFAQFGIKAGVNVANEISTITNGFSTKNLTGYQIGVVYQAIPKKSGAGCEIGLMLSQKGSTFIDNTNVNAVTEGYKELNYLEIPFNMRYHITLGIIGIYATAGIYGGYLLSGKTVNEITNNIQEETFQTFTDHLDYGYNTGLGVELFKKIQLGLAYSQGLKNTLISSPDVTTSNYITNRVFSVNLVYLFK